MKAYRKRQEEAQLLASKRLSLEKIADKLGSDVETVKKWVKAGKKSKVQPIPENRSEPLDLRPRRKITL